MCEEASVRNPNTAAERWRPSNPIGKPGIGSDPNQANQPAFDVWMSAQCSQVCRASIASGR
mgnify:CR=1 FL=1